MAAVGASRTRIRSAVIAAVTVPLVGVLALPSAGATAGSSGRLAPRAAFPSQVLDVTPPSSGRTLYVAPTGADYLPDGWREAPNSEAAPWRTIRMAIRRAQPGDTIVVRAGEYAEAIGWGARPGRPDARITLQAAPGERVVVRGTLQLDGASYWTVRGFAFTRGATSSKFVVKINGGTGWQFLDNEVYGNREVSNMMVSGLAPQGAPHDYVIAGNCIHDIGASALRGQDHNLYLMPGTTSGPGLIERNVMYGAPNGGNIKAAGNAASSSPANVVIQHNTLARAGSGIILGLASTRVRMHGNLIAMPIANITSNGFDAGIKGYSLSGRGNAADANDIVGYKYPVRVNEVSKAAIANVKAATVDPKWEGVGCSALRPTNPAAAPFGHLAP